MKKIESEKNKIYFFDFSKINIYILFNKRVKVYNIVPNPQKITKK